MWNQLLAGTEKLSAVDSVLYAVLGFLVVFAGISFLIAVVWLVGKLIYKSKQETVKPIAPVPVQAQEVKNDEVDEVDEETLAVITAALMAYYQTNNPKCEFIVKRIKRI